MKNIYKILLLIILSMLMMSCGFKLRGKEAIPLQMKNTYLESNNPYDSLEIGLKKILTAMGTNFADTKQQATITLNIISTSFTHDNPNIASSSQATLYNFNYTVSFNIIDKNGKIILPKKSVSAQQTLTMGPGEVLEASNEVNTSKQEMQNEVIEKIIDIITAKDTKKQLAINKQKTGILKKKYKSK